MPDDREIIVGVASLALAVVAVVFCLLPLVYTLLMGVVMGIVALLLGVWGRKQLAEQGRSTGVATTGLILGVVATLLGGLLYGTFISSADRADKDLVRGVGSEPRRGQELGGEEFVKSMKRIIDQSGAKQK
jgi:Na+-driven multidrug efflux pump